MNETVDIKSKATYYSASLDKWGFCDDHCYNCGIKNCDLNGLLMQCGKCKKAYYCGMKCFNEHLPEHNKYCVTKRIDSEPKGGGLNFLKFDTDVVIPCNDDPPPSKTTKKKKSKKKKSLEPSLEKVEPQVEDIVTELPELDDEGSLCDEISETCDKFSKSFSEFGRGSFHFKDVEGEFVPEEVLLRHAELLKREYPWMSPEWIDAQLRKTARGKALYENKGLGDSITNANFMENGNSSIEWEKPAWTNTKLRKTKKGEEIKQGIYQKRDSGDGVDDLHASNPLF